MLAPASHAPMANLPPESMVSSLISPGFTVYRRVVGLGDGRDGLDVVRLEGTQQVVDAGLSAR